MIVNVLYNEIKFRFLFVFLEIPIEKTKYICIAIA